jgi:hypothetical protein
MFQYSNSMVHIAMEYICNLSYFLDELVFLHAHDVSFGVHPHHHHLAAYLSFVVAEMLQMFA